MIFVSTSNHPVVDGIDGDSSAVQVKELTIRTPKIEDGAKIWSLVKKTGVLDVNSPYSYLMMAKFFNDTCIVAEEDNEIVGFVTGFIQPTAPDTYFVWQVAVDDSQRGKGLASKMIQSQLQKEVCENVSYLEATVSPSNIPSESLFLRIARDLNTECNVSECFSEDMFPGDDHEEERTFRIGPF